MQPDIKSDIDNFVGNGPDASFLRSILTPAPSNYESDFVKFAKASGVIPDGVIKVEGGLASAYNEDGTLSSCGIASADGIDFHYKYQYVKYHDKSVTGGLKNGDKISFIDDSDESSDEDSGGIRYQSFISKIYKLNDPDTVVLPCSYIDIHFNSPCWRDNVTFKIHAEDEMIGFTRLELMKAALERFHLLYYLFKNYNAEEGRINLNSSSCWFSPVLRVDEYSENGLKSLIYNKEKGYWIFECIEYP